MARSSFFKKKSKGINGIIFDIGSGHIGAALVTILPDEKPVIHFSTRSPMVFQKHIDFDRFLEGMLSTLKTVSDDLEKNGIPKLHGSVLKRKNIDAVLCVFSSPWYISQTRIIKYEKKKAFLVTKDFIEKMIERAEGQFEKSSQLQKVRKKLRDSEVIEEHVVHTKLNGYSTTEPYGKNAKTVELSLFLSMISKEVESKTKKIFEKIFHSPTILFHSFVLASFSSIRDIFHSEDNFILIDIGGEVTDVSLIRESVLLETVSFPTGKNFLMRSIALDLGISPEEAHSRIRMHLETEGAEVDGRLTKVLDDAEAVWLKSLQHAYVEVGDSQLLPNHVFLTADPDLGKWFKQIIIKDDFKQYTLTGEPFAVITVGEKELYKHSTLLNGVSPDPFLTLETLFLKKIINK